MQKIVVRDSSIGSCTIEYKKTNNEDNILTLKKEYTIKALAALQLLCINITNEDDDDFDRIIDILQNTINDIELINNSKGLENEELREYYD